MRQIENKDARDVGKRIGQVRKAKGLSTVAFAQKLSIPVWCVEIAEHGVISEEGGMGEVVLPIELGEIVQAVAEGFGVSLDWLHTGEGEGIAAAAENAAADELTVYMPVTISPESLMDRQEQLLLLVTNDAPRQEERTECELAYVRELFELMHIYRQVMTRQGKEDVYRAANKRLKDLLDQRIAQT